MFLKEFVDTKGKFDLQTVKEYFMMRKGFMAPQDYMHMREHKNLMDEFMQMRDLWKIELFGIKEVYRQEALMYAERFGICEYRVTNNKMVYYKGSYDNGYSEKPVIYKHTVDLRNMSVITTEMNRRPHGKYVQF